MYFQLHRYLICLIPLILVLTGTAYSANTQVQGNKVVQNDIEPIFNMEDFVPIKGNTFIMGDILRRDQAAIPPHRVKVDDFLISKYEVTFVEYDRFCEATGQRKPDDQGWGRGNRPVINVSWKDATAYTKWLSIKTGRKIRLPSEAEWEDAARAGTSTNYWWGNRLIPNMANCSDCGSQWSRKMTAPVGSFKPNPWGLYDMTGNVYEWCQDALHETYEKAPTDGSVWSGGDESQRINRGGCWRYSSTEMTTYVRSWHPAEERNNVIGFRLVVDNAQQVGKIKK